jgi:hypothetical protein
MSEDTPDASLQKSAGSNGSAEPPTPEKPSLGKVLKQFVTHVDSLADTLPLTTGAIGMAKALALAQLHEFKQEHATVTNDNYHNAKHIIKRLKSSEHATTLITRGFLVSIVSQYDAFLGDLIRTLFTLKPNFLNISERQMTYAELVTFASIEAAREHIIEKEVETVLRKSHSEQFDWLENKFDLQLRKGLELWPRFIELTERRNLFVHASGLISQHYLDVCDKHAVTHGQRPARGQQLDVTPAYFADAYECILEIGVKLVHTLWRKQLPHDREEADDNLNWVCYDLLVEKRFVLARRLLDFAVGQKRHASDVHRRRFIINCAQAYKWSGDETTARKLIASVDWSASKHVYVLATKVLLDDFDGAAVVMKEIGVAGEPTKTEYRDWPLFSTFRYSDEFRSTFAEIFGEDFSESPPRPANELVKLLSEVKNLFSLTEASLALPSDSADAAKHDVLTH